MPADRDALIKELEAWLLGVNPDVDQVSATTDIIETRTVTSLQFVELILQIEDMRGESIPADAMNLDSFRTLESIVDTYLKDVGSNV